MQILWPRCCSRIVDLKLTIIPATCVGTTLRGKLRVNLPSVGLKETAFLESRINLEDQQK